MLASYNNSVVSGHRFEETRYLTDAEALGKWLNFRELKPNNPALHMSGKCLSDKFPEANLVSGLWFSFSRNPKAPRCNQVRVTGWISVLFFNSSGLIRQGDETNGSTQVLATTEEQIRLQNLYGPTAATIIGVCQPAMKKMAKLKIDRKKARLQAHYHRNVKNK